MLRGKGQQPSWSSFLCDTPEIYPAEKAGPLAGRQTDRQTDRASSRQWSWKVDGTQSQTLATAGIFSKSIVPMLIGPKNITIL